jgi:hypothetical protein
MTVPFRIQGNDMLTWRFNFRSAKRKHKAAALHVSATPTFSDRNNTLVLLNFFHQIIIGRIQKKYEGMSGV